MSSLKYSGMLESGLKYEVHDAKSISGMEEIALMIEGKPVSVITITRKRNGALEIVPVLNQKVRLPGFKEMMKEEESVSNKNLKED